MNLLATARGRRLLFALLYLCEGAPIGFLWWTLPTLLREAGVGIDRIGMLAGLLALPWGLKFLWAPLVDVLQGPRFGLRGWIVAMQVTMVATLIPLLVLDLSALRSLLPLLLIHAVAAATQDAAIDALAIRSTPAAERGRLNGWMQAGMLAGRAALGGGALVLIGDWGAQGVVLSLLAVVAGTLVLALYYRPPEAPTSHRRWRAFGHLLAGAARFPETWLGLGFAVVAGAGFEAVGALAGPFLVDAGLDAAGVGRFFALPAVGAMIVGALAGGRLADRGDRRAVAGGFLTLLAGCILATAVVGASGAGGLTLQAMLGLVYLGIGLFTAASYALFMDLTRPELGATQFSAFMGATNLCEAWAAAAGGALAAGRGYPGAFSILAAASLAALPLLPLMRPGRPSARLSGEAPGPATPRNRGTAGHPARD